MLVSCFVIWILDLWLLKLLVISYLVLFRSLPIVKHIRFIVHRRIYCQSNFDFYYCTFCIVRFPGALFIIMGKDETGITTDIPLTASTAAVSTILSDIAIFESAGCFVID